MIPDWMPLLIAGVSLLPPEPVYLTGLLVALPQMCIRDRSYITDYIHLRDCTNFERTGKAISYHISPQSFYQVNPEQTEKLYSLALEYAGLTGKESVWDLYCGRCV